VSVEYFEVELSRVVETVRRVLEGVDYVVAAVVFGSVLRRRLVRDVDVGVLARRPLTIREVAELSSKLEEALGVGVDVVPLAEVPPHLRFKALSEGVRALVRDPPYYHYVLSESFMELVDLDVALTYSARLRRGSEAPGGSP